MKIVADFVIGVLPKGLDDLVQALVFPKTKVFYLTEKNSPEADWIEEFLPKKQILEYVFSNEPKNLDRNNLENILRYSNLTEVLKKQKIKFLVFSNSHSLFLKKWSEEYKIQIIATPYPLQKKFENKIWFDRFLAKHKIPRPESRIYNFSRKTPIFKNKMVLQKAHSWGSEGTFFLKNEKDFNELIADKKIKKNENCLLRQFVQGKSYGITVFVGSDLIALSALREQCFYPEKQFGKINFAGIQWVLSQTISAELAQKINAIFSQLGKLLHREKFLGYANFDFIADQNAQVYLIECNPRFSASNPQLLQFPALIGEISTEQFFLRDFLKNKKFEEFQLHAFQNKNRFAGTNLQIKVPPKTTIQKLFQNGLYGFKKNEITYLDADIRQLKFQGKEFLFHSNTSLGRYYPEMMDIANVITNFPLFDQAGKLNLDGQKIVRKFTY